MTKITAIILAAGQGTRMKSPLPKVLHPVCGQPMIARTLMTCRQAGFHEARLILGHGSDLVRKVTQPLITQLATDCKITIFEQKNQYGTADAVSSAELDSLEGDVIIVGGDHPLITAQDLKKFIADFHQLKLDLAVISVVLDQPHEFGRIVREGAQFKSIVEAKEASSEILKIKEVNTGIYVVKAEVLKKFVPQIQNNNAKKEFYLTDLISLAIQAGCSVQALECKNKNVAHGVNTQSELAAANEVLYRAKAEQLMDSGVIFIDPKTCYIDETVMIGPGTIIYPGVFIRGKTVIGPFSVLEPNVFITDSILADGVQIKAGSYIEDTQIKSQVHVGPYARLRPDTVIEEKARIGNFVELKKVHFGARSKAGHLTYLGDAEIGEDVNIGCGTITCNYAADGKKYKTVIGDRVFVGSDTQFIAPIEIGSDSIVASGSTVTKSVPAGDLAIARARQENKADMAKKFKPLKDS
jgi:bifunctional UDP-N-acetylglucosamine pyrophosphorylase / glucosamine-1-phosphate N-acetyltransferase